MLWNASVLSTTSSDTEPTVVITFDSAKYIFNVGENTTRAFLQSRQNWKKTRALFVTSVGTQRASGLPGKVYFIYNGSYYCSTLFPRPVHDLGRCGSAPGTDYWSHRAFTFIGFYAEVHLPVGHVWHFRIIFMSFNFFQ